MDDAITISRLKTQLLRDVGELCRREDRIWSGPIVRMVRELREAGMQAVFFGGTLRSLLLSRTQSGRFGRPRDVDIVVAGASTDILRERFRRMFKRETRFGGIQLERMNWQFDVWPLQQTWAFRNDNQTAPHFSALPSTTFFNIEAVAVDVWPAAGQPRSIYSGNDQFFEGIVHKTLEINKEDNPFPALCVVRALVFASATGFAVGPRLAQYMARFSPKLTNEDLEEVQRKHYGKIRCEIRIMRRWLDYTSEHVERDPSNPFKLPAFRQMPLWLEEERPILGFHDLRSSDCVDRCAYT